MLLLKKFAQTIDNVTIFADDQDKNRFWYLSGDIHFTMKDGEPVFSLVHYMGDAAKKGGGYLTFQVDTSLTDETKERIFEQFKRGLDYMPKNWTLDPVPFDRGEVKCFALDLKKDEQILCAASPSLFGKNTAVFNATLTNAQAQIVAGAFSQGAKPVSIAYILTYTGMSPELDVEVTANYENIQDYFGAEFTVGAVIPVSTPVELKAKLDAAFQSMVEKKAIIINVKSYSSEEDARKKKEWALEWVKTDLLKEMFKATLPVIKVTDEKKSDESEGGGKKESDAGEKVSEAIGDAGQIVDAMATAGLPTVGVNLKYVGSKETRTLTFNYNESRAIKETIIPQSVLALGNVPRKEPYYTEVDLTSPFFKSVDYNVVGPTADFKEIGLQSADFNLTYNGNYHGLPDPFVEAGQQYKMSFAMSKKTGEEFQTTSKFVFHGFSKSGWEGEKYVYEFSYNSPVRSMNLIPENYFTFKTINVKPSVKFKWDDIEMVTVKLNYKGKNGWEKTKDLEFTENGPKSAAWKLRLGKEDTDNYSAQVIYFTADGEEIETAAATHNDSTLIIYNLKK